MIFQSLAQFATKPFQSSYKVYARLNPNAVWEKYISLAKAQGFKGTAFILSFDCDFEADIPVVEKMDDSMRSFGISPVYVVPGELLEKGAAVYRRLSNRGAEFLNHGYLIHATYIPETNEYRNTLFYHELSQAEVERDILRGHETHLKVLGKAPKGIRTPHFGLYQEKQQLALIYKLAEQLSYQFSTSTVPSAGLLRGPAQLIRPGFWEFPVSGCFDYPTQILDSWGFRNAPDRHFLDEQYVEQIDKLLEFFDHGENPGFLNLYADPWPVHNWHYFFEGMRLLAPLNIPSYEALLSRFKQ